MSAGDIGKNNDKDYNPKNNSKFSSPNKLIFVIIGICIIVGIGGVSGYLYFTDQQKQLQNKLDEIQKQKQQVESQKQQEEITAQKTQQQLQDQANQKQLELQQQQQQAAQQASNAAQQLQQQQQQAAQQQAQLQQQAAQQAAQQQAQLQQQQQQAAQQAAQQQAQLQQQQQQAAQQAAQQQVMLQQQQQQAQINQLKDQYITQAQSNALVSGIIKGYINFYIDPLPSYADPSVENAVNNVVSALDGKTILGIPVHRVYDSQQADIYVQWVKDYGPTLNGETIFGRNIQVGLGASDCGTWEPFNGFTVQKILWHELGHSFGYRHSSDPENVMYPSTNRVFAEDFDRTDLLANNYYRYYYFCHGGSNSFQISSDNQYAGFNTYVVPPNTAPADVISGKAPYYVSCSRNNMASYSNTCSVKVGSFLLVNNPYRPLGGNDQNIHVVIIDTNQYSSPNMAWDPAAWTMTQAEYNQITNLFHNSP